jgi:hypothetical protein
MGAASPNFGELLDMKTTDWNSLEKYRWMSKQDYDALLSSTNLASGLLTEGRCPSCASSFQFAPPVQGPRYEAICACPYGCGYWGGYPEFFGAESDPIRSDPYDTISVCRTCSASYAVHGIAVFCPHCAVFNSRQAFLEKLEDLHSDLSVRTGDASQTAREVERVLSDAVSAFDGYGRATLRGSLLGPEIGAISFQSLTGARKNLLDRASYDLAAGVTADEWQHAVRCFQKRHLLAHNWGVVDEKYVRETGDTEAVVGRKVKISGSEVERLLEILGQIARHYYGNIAS